MSDLAVKKRTVNCLTLHQRLEILNTIEKGFPIRQIANNYGLAIESVWRIRRNASKIRESVKQGANPLRRRTRLSKYDDVDEQLYNWYREQKTKGAKVTNKLLMKKAVELSRAAGGPSTFKASGGWLQRFKQRWKLPCQIKTTTNNKVIDDKIKTKEKVERSNNDNFIKQFNQRLKDESVCLHNVYSMDYTVLLWKAFPRSVLSHTGEEQIYGNIMKKNCITFGLCANVTGSHKISPILINQCENPRALKHITKCNLPVTYKTHKFARMTQNIFLDWYNNYFKKSVQKYQLESGKTGKVFLLINNRNTYFPPEWINKDAYFELLLLPLGLTSILSPMSHIVEKIKLNFRYYLLKHMSEYPCGLKEFYIDYDIGDCITMLVKSWRTISTADINNSWTNLLNIKPDNSETLDDTFKAISVDLQELINNIIGREVPPANNEVTEWISSCIEAEKKYEEETVKDTITETAENTECREENIQLKTSSQNEEIERSFRIISEWAETRNDFIKFQFHVLKDCFNKEI
ncbi:tigger transposable element-derived protein 2-like [Pseudomyrmex gracilis]|uniref:tigger transposable element-derived protein 2-like n=1 Tax=Pseudomyrmex gracilis TaxID=219809 RepID=UPI00099599CC|nr:tigger transposable element-derived protein 2-like [Pseudomyrmex gracilis]